jgi:hypothetical protein
MPFMSDYEIALALGEAADLLAGMTEANRDKWAAWLVDVVADERGLRDDAAGHFLEELHRHLRGRVADVETGEVPDDERT